MINPTCNNFHPTNSCNIIWTAINFCAWKDLLVVKFGLIRTNLYLADGDWRWRPTQTYNGDGRSHNPEHRPVAMFKFIPDHVGGVGTKRKSAQQKSCESCKKRHVSCPNSQTRALRPR